MSEVKKDAPPADSAIAPKPSAVPQIIGSMEKVCPYDQTPLVDDLPAWFMTFLGTLYRRCPTCRRQYRSSPATDLLASRSLGLLSLVGATPTLPRIESAQRETNELGEQVEKLRKELESIQEELPAPNREIASVREALSGVENRLGDMGRELEEARTELLELIPEATDLAYLKLAKAEVAEVRGLLTRHIEDHQRQQASEAAGSASRLAKIAIAVSVFGVVATAAGLVVRSQ